MSKKCFDLIFFQESIRKRKFIDQSINYIMLNVILYLFLWLFRFEFVWILFKIYDSNLFYFIWIYD